MRKSLLFLAIPVAAVGVGAAIFFGTRTKSDTFLDDLQAADVAGLELAQSQAAAKFALSEIPPEAKPEPAKTVKRAPGNRVVRSAAPTVRATPVAEPAQAVEEIPVSTVIATSAAEGEAATAPVVPRPAPETAPVPVEEEGAILRGGTGRGTGDNGGGMGGGGLGGVIWGVVIRGGGVDGDNCELHRPGRPTVTRTPVYGGNPSGMGGARNPMPRGPLTPVVGSRPTIGSPASGPMSGGRTASRPRGSR